MDTIQLILQNYLLHLHTIWLILKWCNHDPWLSVIQTEFKGTRDRGFGFGATLFRKATRLLRFFWGWSFPSYNRFNGALKTFSFIWKNKFSLTDDLIDFNNFSHLYSLHFQVQGCGRKKNKQCISLVGHSTVVHWRKLLLEHAHLQQ